MHQSRARISKRGNFSCIYNPNAQDKKNVKKKIIEILNSYDDSVKKHYNIPKISLIFKLEIPSTMTKLQKDEYQSYLVRHVKKPDTDNFVKFIVDCLDEILFDGDQRAYFGCVHKIYHRYPGTIVMIEEGSPYLGVSELPIELERFLSKRRFAV